MKIKAGARSSRLSRVQVDEVLAEIRKHHPQVQFEMTFVLTRGDKDKKTSLRTLSKDDFFTRELDEMLLDGKIDIAIHSAKDLPEPLPAGLIVVALTKGVDPRDSLVFRPGEKLRPGMKVATSSVRREEMIHSLCPDLHFIDLRGTIEERLQKLNGGEADAIVLAEAALIRLQLTHLNRILLPGPAAPLQGRLAIVTQTENHAMRELFYVLHFRLLA